MTDSAQPGAQPGPSEGPGPDDLPKAPSASQSMGALWLFTLLRFAIFFALWGLLYLARVPGFLAAFIALLLSMPLSFVLLRKQREKVAENIEQRMIARRAHQQDLDTKLSGDDE